MDKMKKFQRLLMLKSNLCQKFEKMAVDVGAGFGIESRKSFATGRILCNDGANYTLGTWDNKMPFDLDKQASQRYGLPIPKVTIDNIGVKSEIGRRPSNEDFYKIQELPNEILYLAIFDGHGGPECANFASSHLDSILKNKILTSIEKKKPIILEEILRSSILHLNKQFFQYIRDENPDASASGSTAVVALIRESTQLVVAHVGDSRAILSRRGKSIDLTIDHSVDVPTEKKRIYEAGGKILADSHGSGRVAGRLAMTRCLGHEDLKDHGIIALPDIQKVWIHPHQDAFLVMITDGICTCVPNCETHALVTTASNPQEGAKNIVETAMCYGADDNCTAIVMPLPAWGKYSAKASDLSGFGKTLMSSQRFS